MGLPNLTPEEEYLLKKFAALKRKRKALQKAKEKTESPVVIKPGLKRDAPVDSPHAPEDAKEIAKKLIASGEVKIKKDPVHREFKRAKGGERRIKDFQQQPSSSNRNEQQSRAAAMKNLYESFVPSSASQNRRFSGGQGPRGSWSEEPRKGNTIYVKGIGLTEKILQESFTQFGKVHRVNFEKERSQGFVTFDSCDEAEKAIAEMNGMMVSSVHIKVALSRRQPNMGDANFRPRPGLGSRDSRGHSSGLQSREAREIVSYEDI
ncbi:negative elongation factor E-like [Montipora foliosa]|uniref:negative elongation factor E-like n=1 Tax=Montipora foliosa TaxID=591990 RepID=UPI0035F17E46